MKYECSELCMHTLLHIRPLTISKLLVLMDPRCVMHQIVFQIQFIRFDRLLSVGVKLISGQRPSIYTVVLRELAGQFYLMAGQFMHLCWLKAVGDQAQMVANLELYVSYVLTSVLMISGTLISMP